MKFVTSDSLKKDLIQFLRNQITGYKMMGQKILVPRLGIESQEFASIKNIEFRQTDTKIQIMGAGLAALVLECPIRIAKFEGGKYDYRFYFNFEGFTFFELGTEDDLTTLASIDNLVIVFDE